MITISRTYKKQIDHEYEAIRALEKKCASCRRFSKKIADNIFTYCICNEYLTDAGPAMIAIAEYGKEYAIYTPKYLSEEQLVVFKFLLQEMEEDDKIIVFSLKSFAAIKKYSYGKPVNVKFHI